MTTKELAEKAGITPRSIQKLVKKAQMKGLDYIEIKGIRVKFSYVDGRGCDGKVIHYYIAPSEAGYPSPAIPSLQWQEQKTGKLPAPHLMEKAKRIALARLDLLRSWEEYRKNHPGLNGQADKEFLKGYNSGIICPQIYEVLGEVSKSTLYNWKAIVGNTGDYRLLMPQWFNQARQEALSEKEKKVFMSLLLHPNKIRIGTAVRLTKYYLERNGEKMNASPATFRRFAERFKRLYADRWVLMREGQKALRDKIEPFIQRDPSVLEVGDVLVADGHRLNFKVINPFTGKPCRATLVGYIDWKSYCLVGYEIMIEENTQCIASALRNAIIRLGKLPKITYQDNGKAFRARFFTSTGSFEESGLYGLLARLGIIPVFAQPYNARAKVIERWFKEFSDTFERLLPSFVGTNINDKPAHMLRNEKFHKAIHNEYIPTIEETIQLIEEWLDFQRSQSCPHVSGKTIGEVFEEGRGQGVDIDELNDLMMATEVKTIGRNGIRFLKADYYDDNLYGLRDQVLIKYSLFDLSYIKVYDRKGNFLCTAYRRAPVNPMAHHFGDVRDMEELKRRIAEQRRLERKTIEAVKFAIDKTVELDWQKIVNVSPKLIEKLSDTTMPAIEEHIPSEAVQSLQSVEAQEVQAGRPFFGNNIERYEWHLKNGIETEEDRQWVMWYKATDEYRMAFEFFEKQEKEVMQ